MFIALRKENYAVAKKGLIWGFMMVGVDVAIGISILAVESYMFEQQTQTFNDMKFFADKEFSFRENAMHNCISVEYTWKDERNRTNCLPDELEVLSWNIKDIVKREGGSNEQYQELMYMYENQLRSNYVQYCIMYDRYCQ